MVAPCTIRNMKRNRANPKRNAVQVRMTDKMLEALELAADKDKSTTAEYIRKLINENTK